MLSTTISLCVVVKDEELFLQECLESVRGAVDEMVVVDTGSSDRTMDIARGAGARVFEEPWPGDLARAHDLPVLHASGAWILSLDGDEALDRERGGDVRALAAQRHFDGFLFTVHNYLYRPRGRHRFVDPADPQAHGARGWVPSRNVRLFRNDPRFRHEGRVHQTVRDAMNDAGARVGVSSIPIHHYGYLRTDRHKSALYATLAARQTADCPDDAKAQLELGLIYLADRRWDAALDCFRRAQALGDPAESWFFIGMATLEQRHPDAAIACFRKALEGVSALRHFVEEAEIWEALGQAYVDLHIDGEAASALRRCLELRPDSPDAAFNLMGVLARSGDANAARRLAEGLTARYPGLPASWEARGYEALLAGQHRRAAEHFERAIDIDPGRSSSQFNLAIAQARVGDATTAARTMTRALATDHADWVAPRLGVTSARGAAFGPVPDLGSEGVLSVIAHLSGGAALVATALARALGPSCPQLLATVDPGAFTGESHQEELTALGVGVVVIRDASELATLLGRTRPGVVIHHWWPTAALDRIARQGPERLIIRSASPLPMPPGYDRYVTLSAFQARYQRHLPPALLHCIPNGVDVRRFAGAIARDEYWPVLRGVRPVRVAMVSRLDPDKFLRRLPDVVAPVLDLPVVIAIAGRGGRRYEIEPELDRRGMSPQVRFLGPLPQREVPSLLAGADIGLHLTETHQESHSLTVLQMMAAGLPVVAQPRGCLPELIEDGVTGDLASSEQELTEALRRLIVDEDRRRECAAAARRNAAGFDIAVFAERWRNLVRSVRHSAA